jgi:hypothetical protein
MKRNSGGIAHKVPIHMGLTGLSLPKNYSTCSKSQSKDAGIIDHFFYFDRTVCRFCVSVWQKVSVPFNFHCFELRRSHGWGKNFAGCVTCFELFQANYDPKWTLPALIMNFKFRSNDTFSVFVCEGYQVEHGLNEYMDSPKIHQKKWRTAFHPVSIWLCLHHFNVIWYVSVLLEFVRVIQIFVFFCVFFRANMAWNLQLY